MWLSTYHLSSNLIWFDLLYLSIRRSSGPPICLFLYLSSPVLSCPILSYMSFRSCDMCIYLVIYRFPFFLYIFIEFNRLIDPSVYPLRCTHGTRRCSTRGRPKWMHLPRPSGWKKVGGLWFGAFGAGRTRGSKSAGNSVVLLFYQPFLF